MSEYVVGWLLGAAFGIALVAGVASLSPAWTFVALALAGIGVAVVAVTR